MKRIKTKYFNRDLSWLSFNYRVLQEAKNKEVPLLERLKFLAIYSSNLDEFYRVRIGLLRHQLSQDKNREGKKKLLQKIKKKVGKQLNEFGRIYRRTLLPQLARNRIFIVNGIELNRDQQNFIEYYFRSVLLPLLKIEFLSSKKDPPFLENKQLYFALKLKKLSNDKTEYAIVNIPSDKQPRFIQLQARAKDHLVIFLDDIVRRCLHFIFPAHEIKACHSIKISRDAELYLEEEEEDDLVEEIKSKLVRRKTNPPARFLYDSKMPKDLLKFLRQLYVPVKDFMIPGGRYHNFEDFFSFPSPDKPRLKYPVLKELNHKVLDQAASMFEAIAEKDQLLHFPYQRYDYVIRFLEEAADDKQVTRIRLTLYRVPDDSRVAAALLKAAENGKDVSVFMEVKARFNEMINIYWAQKFEEAGIKVIYSFKKLKVHSKVCLVERNENGGLKRYAYVSTGNFHEKTARVYCDYGYLTADPALTKDTERIFKYFNNPAFKPKFKEFLVAPFNLRSRMLQLIRNEIKNAKARKKAQIILKVNNLEDPHLIERLYRASEAGVKITIIVRGICCLIPGVKGMSRNIRIISIVDRYLEHARVFIFHANGQDHTFISSADLMTRNLNRRIETVFPVYDEQAKAHIRHTIDLQLKDNTKARMLNKTQSNPYKPSRSSKKVRAQMDTYKYLLAGNG